MKNGITWRKFVPYFTGLALLVIILASYFVPSELFQGALSNLNLGGLSTAQNSPAVKFLINQEIVSGYTNGNYQSSKFINRAEMLKIIIVAASKTGKFSINQVKAYQNKPCFSDLKPSDWYVEYICFAKQQGIIAGYADNTFRPSRGVFGVEAYQIALKAFDDFEGISEPWYQVYQQKMQSDYLVDTQNSLKPMTRGQMADMVTRMLMPDQSALEDYIQDGTLPKTIRSLSARKKQPKTPATTTPKPSVKQPIESVITPEPSKTPAAANNLYQAPQIISPSNNSQIKFYQDEVNPQFTIEWKGQSAKSFQVAVKDEDSDRQLSLNSINQRVNEKGNHFMAFSTKQIFDSTCSSCQISIHVIDDQNQQISPKSSVVKFEISAGANMPLKNPASLSSPQDQATITGAPLENKAISYSWQSVSGASKYSVLISNDTTNSFQVLDYTTSTSYSQYFQFPASGKKVQYWKVRAYDANGEWTESVARSINFEVVIPVPTVTISEPKQGAIITLATSKLNSMTKIKWQNSGVVQSKYQIWVTDRENGNRVNVFEGTGSNVNEYDLSLFFPTTGVRCVTCSVSVEVYDPANNRVQSSAVQFTISDPTLSPPNVISPTNERIFQSSLDGSGALVRFEWVRENRKNFKEYILKIASSTGSILPPVIIRDSSVHEMKVPPGNYSWSITGVSLADPSINAISTTQKFVVTQESGATITSSSTATSPKVTIIEPKDNSDIAPAPNRNLTEVLMKWQNEGITQQKAQIDVVDLATGTKTSFTKEGKDSQFLLPFYSSSKQICSVCVVSVKVIDSASQQAVGGPITIYLLGPNGERAT